MAANRKDSQRVLAALKRYGLLLQTDARLPNVCALVTGAPIRGSWWAHPRSHDIFRVSCHVAEHPDVLVIKLVSSKVTYVHRALWPYVVTIGRGGRRGNSNPFPAPRWSFSKTSTARRSKRTAASRSPLPSSKKCCWFRASRYTPPPGRTRGGLSPGINGCDGRVLRSQR